jgi:hypothetical protein
MFHPRSQLGETLEERYAPAPDAVAQEDWMEGTAANEQHGADERWGVLPLAPDPGLLTQRAPCLLSRLLLGEPTVMARL